MIPNQNPSEPRNTRRARNISDHRFSSLALVLLSCVSCLSWFAGPVSATGISDTTLTGPDTAVRLDGTDDTGIIFLGSGLIANTSTITMEGWVFPENAAPSFPDFDGFFGVRQNSIADFYLLQLGAKQIEARFRNSAGTAFTLSPSPLLANRWQHLALTYDGTTLRFYHNGREVDSVAANGQITTPSQPFLIGYLPFGADRFNLRGQVDELRIWREARSATQIRENMHRNLTGGEANLVAYYRMAMSTGSDSCQALKGDTPIQFGNVNTTTIWVRSRAVIGDSQSSTETNLRAAHFSDTQSLTSNGLAMNASGIADSLTFSLFGNDNDTGTSTADLPVGASERLRRTWRPQVSGAVTASLIFNVGQVGGESFAGLATSRYLLLRRSGVSGTFTTETTGASSVSGSQITFAALSVTDSVRYTLGILPSNAADTPRIRFLASTPIDTRSASFSIRVSIDSATIGDSVRLSINGVQIETQTMTAAAETRTFTYVSGTYLNTGVIAITRQTAGDTFSDSNLVRLDTLGPSGSVLTIADTFVRLPTIRWTAATDSNGVARYRVNLISLSDSSTSLTYETTGLSATVDSALKLGVYRADLICTDNLGNVNLSVDSRIFTIYADTPMSFALQDSQTFIVAKNSFASDSSHFIVKDTNGTGVPNYLPVIAIVARPSGATGDTFSATATDSNGRCTVILKAGDKAGVYILKVAVPGVATIYLSYATNDYDLPATTWRMITPNRTPTTAATASAITLAPTRILQWNPLAENSTLNLRYEIPTSLTTGRGYFIFNTTASTFNVSGTTLSTDTTDISLKTGWNMIGPPYAYPTRYNAARIITSGGSNISLSDAEAQGILINKIFWYTNNAYQFGPTTAIADPILSPWNGVWIFAAANATLRISPFFYFAESTTSSLATAQAAGDPTDWRIRISTKTSGGAQTTSFFGVSPTATENKDFALDLENPPPVSGGMASGLGSSGAFAQDLRAPFTTANLWQFAVMPTATDTEVTLDFADLANLPTDFVVMLVDLSTNAIIDVKSAPTYRYMASGAAARSFRIAAGTEAAVRSILAQQLDQSQTFAYPNPGPAADGFVRFKYNVPAGGQLRIRVFDLSGRRVIDRYIDLNAFAAEYAWNCRNDRGDAVGTGVYIYILDIGNSTGNRRFTDKMAIVR